jgi:hypothetical protein
MQVGAIGSATGSRPSGSGHGYRAHLLVCTKTNLPLASTVDTASVHESNFAIDLLNTAIGRGVKPGTLTGDKGYDSVRIHRECEARGVHPVIQLRKTGGVKQGRHLPRVCVHGTWPFHGADYAHRRTKWKCPTNECRPASEWRKASRLHPMVPYQSRRWWNLYYGRNAVESEFSRLKMHFGLRRPRVRGRDRMKLWIDLVVFARLASALAEARAGPTES